MLGRMQHCLDLPSYASCRAHVPPPYTSGAAVCSSAKDCKNTKENRKLKKDYRGVAPKDCGRPRDRTRFCTCRRAKRRTTTSKPRTDRHPREQNKICNKRVVEDEGTEGNRVRWSNAPPARPGGDKKHVFGREVARAVANVILRKHRKSFVWTGRRIPSAHGRARRAPVKRVGTSSALRAFGA